MLLQHKHCPLHVFGDICERVPPTQLDEMKGIMQDCLKQSNSITEMVCEISPSDKAKLAELRQQRDALGKELVGKLVQCLQEVTFLKNSFCYKCQRMCPLIPSVNRDTDVLLEIAGTTCVAWSSMRSCGVPSGRWLHFSTLPCLVWIFWVLWLNPDFFIHECVSKFDFQILVAYLRAHFVFSLNFSPKHLGLPANRTRRFTIGVPVPVGGRPADGGTSRE